ncbi:MAG TPA: MBL fold metallo-hydrolase [Bacteroidales bacterium]
MKISFLGTGTSLGVPVVACQCKVCRNGAAKDKRLRSSIMVEEKGTTIVIDAGPDFRYQMLRENVKHVDAILITHHHQDHVAGLDDVRSFNFLSGKPMDVYATISDQERIKEEFSYAFKPRTYPGVPSYNLITVDEKAFEVNHLKIFPFKVLHMKMEVLAFKIGDFAYITDVNYIPGNVLPELLNCKVIVLGALQKSKHISHYSLPEAIDVLNFLRPEKAFITHISHSMGFHEEIENQLPAFIRFAYDGLKIEI